VRDLSSGAGAYGVLIEGGAGIGRVDIAGVEFGAMSGPAIDARGALAGYNSIWVAITLAASRCFLPRPRPWWRDGGMSVNVAELPGLDWPRVGLLPVVDAAEQALTTGRGFSLIRLGDGEGAMLSHAAPRMAEDVAFCLRIWFGDQVVVDADRRAMVLGLERAMREADVLGLPRRRQLKVAMRYHEVFANLERVLGARRPVIGDMALHFYLQWSGALGYLVRRARRLVLIGCRDVAGVFAAHFDVPVTQWLVRGEAKFPGSVEETHWPTGYARMMARMDDVGPGDLVLVGAGILGKAYVAAAARRGQPPSISAACSTDGRASSAAKGGSAMVPNFP
jgi:hypothetical protein